MEDNNQKAKSRKQIADEYGISPRTLRRWLKKYDIVLPKRLLCSKEQQMIYESFGHPQAKSYRRNY